MNWAELIKVLGPLVVEILKIIFGSKKQAVENLKARGVIKEHRDK